ncbi:MAG: CapA family protein, partial [Clostridiales bacterium]|nr:CapA family protein [Clostridiales bacterium]
PKGGPGDPAVPAAAPSHTEAPTQTPEPTETPAPTEAPRPTEAPTPSPVVITLSAAGDCTLGGDMLGSTEKQFHQQITKDDQPNEYCFRNVQGIFAADDLTIVNLEVVLTDSRAYDRSDKSKVFIMRGKPAYAQMLPLASIEIANIANNHMTDFGEAGIEETTGYLDEQGVGYCGYGRTLIKEVKGVKVGFVGINSWTTPEDDMKALISDMRAQCDVLVVSFHWGSELEYRATAKQVRYGHMAVDRGADLVLGHHPHVVNGIEVYKGVNIVYSLGNFSFGGKRNPKDKDTFIFQQQFTVQDGEILSTEPSVIPCRITSSSSYNNYQPTPVTGQAADQILKKIEYYSRKFDQALNLID